MQTTIDAEGRVLIPTAVRERLGWTEGQALDIVESGGRLQLAPAPADVRLEWVDGVLTAVPHHPLPVLTAEAVRDTLENVRR